MTIGFIPLPVTLKEYCTKYGNLVYYFNIYTPKSSLYYAPPELKELTYMMWAFKNMASSLTDGYAYTSDYQKNTIKKFTYEIITAISEIIKENYSKNTKIKNIVLLAVPPSTEKNKSTIRGCIYAIVNELLKDNSLKRKYLNVNAVIDGGSVLTRSSDVATSHLAGKNVNTYNDLWNSLTVNKKKLPAALKHDETVYILLDDIVTTGLNMKVCKDKLVDSDIPSDKIVCLAISKTR